LQLLLLSLERGLENRCTGNRTVGSNPTFSANKSQRLWTESGSV